MKFQKTVNIWGLDDDQIKRLQPGQWVSAGPLDPDRRNLGTFCGVKPSGSVVVAWACNARKHPRPSLYRRALMTYAKGR